MKTLPVELQIKLVQFIKSVIFRSCTCKNCSEGTNLLKEVEASYEAQS